MRKAICSLVVMFLVSIFAGSLLTGCSSDSSKLGKPPEGFTFTDENGDPISSAQPGDLIQVRDEDGNLIFSFTMGEDAIDLSDLIAGNDGTVAFAHLGSTLGLSGDITLYVPCEEDTNTLYVTPGADSATEVSTDGSGEGVIVLSILEPGPTEGYTFANAATRTGNEDCEVSADISVFSTGAAGDFNGDNGVPPDQAGITLDRHDFAEAGANMGIVGNTITVTLQNDTFTTTEGTLILDTDYELSGTAIPAGYTLTVTAVSDTELTLTLGGGSYPATDADGVEGIVLTFLDAAFTSGSAPDTAAQTLTLDLDDNAMVVFSAGTFDGDLTPILKAGEIAGVTTSRQAADALCGAKVSEIGEEFGFAGKYYLTALISTQTPLVMSNLAGVVQDQLSDFPSVHSVSTLQKIRSLDKTKIADSWADLLNGSIDTALSTAGVTTGTSSWWSGSESDGTRGTDCNNWGFGPPAKVTPQGVVIYGDYGSTSATDSTWITYGSTEANCTQTKHVLCMVWWPDTE